MCLFFRLQMMQDSRAFLHRRVQAQRVPHVGRWALLIVMIACQAGPPLYTPASSVGTARKRGESPFGLQRRTKDGG